MKPYPECKFSAELDMDTLIIAKGPSFPLAMLATRLFCPRCRKNRMRVIFTPDIDSGRAAAAL